MTKRDRLLSILGGKTGRNLRFHCRLHPTSNPYGYKDRVITTREGNSGRGPKVWGSSGNGTSSYYRSYSCRSGKGTRYSQRQEAVFAPRRESSVGRSVGHVVDLTEVGSDNPDPGNSLPFLGLGGGRRRSHSSSPESSRRPRLRKTKRQFLPLPPPLLLPLSRPKGESLSRTCPLALPTTHPLPGPWQRSTPSIYRDSNQQS